MQIDVYHRLQFRGDTFIRRTDTGQRGVLTLAPSVQGTRSEMGGGTAISHLGRCSL